MSESSNECATPPSCSLELSGKYHAYGPHAVRLEHWTISQAKRNRNALHFWAIRLWRFRVAIGWNRTANKGSTGQEPA